MLPILFTLCLAASPQAVEPVGSLQRLNVPSAPDGIVTLAVNLDGQPSQLVLERHSLRAADFQLFATNPAGELVPVPAPAPKTWRGYIEGRADTIVTASITSEGLSAVVTDYTSDLEWQIQPADGYPAGTYSVAHATDLNVPTGVCGLPNMPQVDPPSVSQNRGGRGTGLQLCELAIDADFEFYQRNGSSVTATIDDVERVMNRVDFIYVRDVDVTFQLTAVVVRSNVNDPYSTNDANTVLDQFRTTWNSSAFTGVRKDIAHLFSGRNMNGSVIGLAYVGVVCSGSIGYGLSESRFTNNLGPRAGLTAHEIGHNFNAQHCDGNGDCRIMCSGLGGCQGDVSRFGTPRGTSIRNYAIGRGCLLDLASPLTIPIVEDCESGLNTDLWISTQGLGIGTAALNEPSGTNSFELDARNANQALDDYIVTNKILLANEANVDLTFFSQHRGVPNGGALVAEFYTAQSDWVELARLVSNGTDQTTFQQNVIPMPAAAYHNELQVRFRTEVDSTAQNWFIDDIEIADDSCGGAVNYCVGASNSVSITGAQLVAGGTTSIAANDLTLAGVSLPSFSFGIWIYGDSQQQAFQGNGFICVNGTPVYRLAVTQSNVFGINSLSIDQNNLATGSVINPGDVFNFQLWYRDVGGSGYNFTDALEITFCP